MTLSTSDVKSMSEFCLELRLKESKCAPYIIFDYLSDFEECLLLNNFCGCCSQITKQFSSIF